MNPRIRVEILSGFAAGPTSEFDKSPVSIGRGPECEVKLHPTKDTQVARNVHARLVLEGDQWWLESCHDSGVKVVGGPGGERLLKNGERLAMDGAVEFELSNGGPRISAVPSHLPLPVTDRNEHGGAPLPVARVVPEELTKHGRQSKRWVAVIAVVLVALTGVGWLVSSSLASRAAMNERKLAGAETKITEAEGKLAQLASASASQIASVKAAVDQVRHESPAALAEVLRKASASVWVVGGLDKDDVFEPIGTAWTVSTTQLATNAHVAEGLRALLAKKTKKISTLVARKDAKGPSQLVLSDAMQVHPGYAEWEARFGTQFQSAAGNRIEAVGFVPACDVALLTVKSGDPGPALVLAGKGDAVIPPASPVGYVGFPMEGVPGFPSQQTVTGVVTNQTDFFFQPSSAENCQLIHHNALVVGGGSGSPLINDRGEVIGLVSAGSVVGQAAGGRIPIGLNFAQRVDVLQELMAGKAAEHQKVRSEHWAIAGTALLKPYDQVISPLTGRDLRLTLLADLQKRLKRTPTEDEAKAFSDIRQVDKSAFTLRRGKVEGAAQMSVQLQPGFAYAFGSAGAGYLPLRMAVVLDKNTKDLLNSGSWIWCPCVSILPDAKARSAEILVWTDRDPAQPIEGVLVMYEYKP